MAGDTGCDDGHAAARGALCERGFGTAGCSISLTAWPAALVTAVLVVGETCMTVSALGRPPWPAFIAALVCVVAGASR